MHSLLRKGAVANKIESFDLHTWRAWHGISEYIHVWYVCMYVCMYVVGRVGWAL